MTWKGRLTRGGSLRVPSGLYFPGHTNSVRVMGMDTAVSSGFAFATPVLRYVSHWPVQFRIELWAIEQSPDYWMIIRDSRSLLAPHTVVAGRTLCRSSAPVARGSGSPRARSWR